MQVVARAATMASFIHSSSFSSSSFFFFFFNQNNKISSSSSTIIINHHHCFFTARGSSIITLVLSIIIEYNRIIFIFHYGPIHSSVIFIFYCSVLQHGNSISFIIINHFFPSYPSFFLLNNFLLFYTYTV